MTRKQELNKVKEYINIFFKQGDCGLFNTRNIVGDSMVPIFKGEYFQLDLCYNWSYFEVFGTIKEEWEELKKFYNLLEELEKLKED